LALTRTAADTLGSISESVVGVVTHGGIIIYATLSDSVGSISESVSRSSTTFSRSAADSISTIGETAGRALGLVRSLGDSIINILETLVWTPKVKVTVRISDYAALSVTSLTRPALTLVQSNYATCTVAASNRAMISVSVSTKPKV
jgi:hypothetical protein